MTMITYTLTGQLLTCLSHVLYSRVVRDLMSHWWLLSSITVRLWGLLYSWSPGTSVQLSLSSRSSRIFYASTQVA